MKNGTPPGGVAEFSAGRGCELVELGKRSMFWFSRRAPCGSLTLSPDVPDIQVARGGRNPLGHRLRHAIGSRAAPSRPMRFRSTASGASCRSKTGSNRYRPVSGNVRGDGHPSPPRSNLDVSATAPEALAGPCARRGDDSGVALQRPDSASTRDQLHLLDARVAGRCSGGHVGVRVERQHRQQPMDRALGTAVAVDTAVCLEAVNVRPVAGSYIWTPERLLPKYHAAWTAASSGSRRAQWRRRSEAGSASVASAP